MKPAVSRTLAVLGTASVFALPSSPAVAAPPDGQPAPSRVDFSRTYSTEFVLQKRKGNDNAVAADSRRQHLQKQAKGGRLLDAKQVQVSVLDGGVMTWEKGRKIDEIRVTHVTTDPSTMNDSNIVDVAVLSSENPAERNEAAAAHGASMQNFENSYGIAYKSADCWTFDARKPDGYLTGTITGCYEKIKPTNDYNNTYDEYIYNRHATAQGRALSWDTDWITTWIDIGSRRHKNYRDRAFGLTNYFPHSPEHLCNEGSSVGVSAGAFSATVPLRSCSAKYPVVDARDVYMGMRFDAGPVFWGRTQGVDFLMNPKGPQGGATPIMADYDGATFCKDTYLNCNYDHEAPGW